MGVFGPTKGNSLFGPLDKRYKSNRGGYTGKAGRAIGNGVASFLSDDDSSDSRSKSNYEEESLEEKILKEDQIHASSINLDTDDIDELCNKLDQLLTNCRSSKSRQDGFNTSIEVYKSKILSGINKLNRKKEIELAGFYSAQLKEIEKSISRTKIVKWITMLLLGVGSLYGMAKLGGLI